MRARVTEEQLRAWLGSDVTTEQLISLVLEIANQDYDPEALRSDVINYEEK